MAAEGLWLGIGSCVRLRSGKGGGKCTVAESIVFAWGLGRLVARGCGRVSEARREWLLISLSLPGAWERWLRVVAAGQVR